MNDTAQSGSAPGRLLLPALVTAQARRTPAATAVLAADGTALDYAGLLALARDYAARLRERGLARGELVAVCLPRSPELVAALLGVWLAGGAYVPIDPEHPAARVGAVLADTGTRTALVCERTAGLLPTGVTRVHVDAPRPAEPRTQAPAPGPEGEPDPHAVPADPALPAYVLHTSGSTGRPKGVLVPHAGIANRVRWLVHRHRLGAGDRMLLKTTVGFDAAALELFAPLIAGASLVLAPEGAERDPELLLRTIRAAGVTVFQGVPSVYRRLVDLADGGRPVPSLRLLFSAGEPLHADLCHRLAALAPGAEIWNTYGPTEASVDITEHRWDPERDTRAVPIGRPIGNLRALVLDTAGRPVPAGAVGELYAGGAGLALGYLGRPALTAERFVPDPLHPGARLYRTGDRVRLRGDGVLEYLGRLDQQVKVNGVRVEPGEVEAALAAHPWVRAAVVATRPDGAGGHRLVAWVQSRGEVLRPEELRAFLRRALPAPLVPSVFVPVDSFALTPNGKIDRKELPEPGTAAPGGQRPVRTPGERAVAEAWAALTGTPVAEIAADHDFFQLGGSSLMLPPLAAALSSAAGHPVPVRALFTATTVTEQAALLAPGAPAPHTSASGPGAGRGPVRPVPRDPAGLPLSPGQQGLWLMDRLRPGTAEWNAPVFVRLPARYTDQTVRAALEALAERHEILRTRYVLSGARPVQLADLPARWELRVEPERAPGDLARLTAREFARPFDLEHGPVRRALLLRGPQTLTLVLSVHHIACDGWSSVVLERDLTALAEAAHTATAPTLPALPVQYADHAAHRLAQLDEERVRAELAHWSEELAGLEPLSLPTDRPRPPVRDTAGAAHVFEVPAALVEQAAALGRGCGASLQQTLLTVFTALVARSTRAADIPVGVPVAGREGPEAEHCVGFFLNTLVLRCAADPRTPFRQALAGVRDTAHRAFAHQDLPFDRLVEALDPARDPSRTPLYQLMFDFHEEGRTGGSTSGADLEAFRHAWRHARTDLTFVLHRRPDGGLAGMIEYATALFDAATVARLADSWQCLLRSFVAAPDQRLGEAELLPPALRAELLAHGSGAPEPGTPAGPLGSVPGAIAENAALSPLDPAVVQGDTVWTYGRLESRARTLAAVLRAEGARPDTSVGVLLARTPELIAAPLAVWKAGAVYVPLDPAAPVERLHRVLSDADARVVITDAAGAHLLDGRWSGRVLRVDLLPDEEGSPSPAGLPVAYEAEDLDRLAYLMYTSGSTGRPKGVGVEHGALARMMHASRAHLDFGQGPDDAWLALAQTTFDISCTELFMPLTAGGRVVLASSREVLDPAAQLALVDRHEVSHLQVGPPHWQLLLDAGLGSRTLVGQTGGEPCPPALARELSRRLVRFVNEYGLTETTIAATRWEATDTARSVPIGVPYPHVSAHVLDAYLRPVPYGVTGELCLGGQGLARGYHGQPALTAAAMVPDPYGPPGSRLYRSGDLARRLADGTIEFAGREDGQAKIRGRRVETDEVRSVLAEHPGVAQSAVVVHGTGVEAALVGYWSPAPGPHPPTDAELLDHCATRLPDYMLPSLLVRLTGLPLTRHGKIDTKALPRPDLAGALALAPYVAPEGPVEEAVAGIWAEVLYGDADSTAPARPVGAREGFFRIGGNSVKAARVVARLHEEFDVELPLRTVFEHPTVTALATAVEDAVRAEIDTLTEAELALVHQEYQP